MALSELIARLEAATEGSRELDARLQVFVNDPPIMVDAGGYRGERPAAYEPLSKIIADGFEDWEALAMQAGAPRYTTSLDAALTLIPTGWAIQQFSSWPAGGESSLKLFECLKELNPHSGLHGCWVHQAGRDRVVDVQTAATPALAFCVAALKAMEDK